MKNAKWIFIFALLSLLLLLFAAGCSAENLKSSQRAPQEETTPIEEASPDNEGEETSEETSGEDETSSQDDATAEDSTSDQAEDTGEEGSDPQPTENPETNCSSLNPHPLGESIAEQFGMTYDEVMTIYCDGYAFSDILLALETEELVELSAEELLAMVKEKTWEEIWDELGVEK